MEKTEKAGNKFLEYHSSRGVEEAGLQKGTEAEKEEV